MAKNASGATAEASPKKPPALSSVWDMTVVEAYNHGTGESYTSFYVLTPEHDVFFGRSPKKREDITLEEYQNALQHVPDSEIYPLIPQDVTLTIAPPEFDDVSAYIKQPGITSYEPNEDTDFIRKDVLDETLIMEQISKNPHPHIVHYHGCRVHRGRITAIVLERLAKTLMQYIDDPEFAHLDKAKFMEALESAVAHLHQLGLAHNDLSPLNVMVRDGLPVLIDFGGCARFGARLQYVGSPGWFEEPFWTSEAKHDIYSLNKIREWLDLPDEEKRLM